MERVYVISTGGTIGSESKGGAVDVQIKGKSDLFDRIKEKFAAEGVTIELSAPLNKLSEDFSCIDIALIMRSIHEAIEQGYTRIVVWHGTDSLHYSVSFSEFLFRRQDIKICFTGSFYEPSDQRSRAKEAACAAIKTVLSPNIHWGTFVALEKADGSRNIEICNALNMRPLDLHDKGLAVQRRDQNSVCEYRAASERQTADMPEIRNALVSPLQTQFEIVPSEENMQRAASLTRLLPSYPGLSGRSLEEAAGGTLAYIISAYHSGTGPSDDRLGSGLPTFLKRYPDKLVIMATHPADSAPYKSVERLIKAGAVVIRGLLPHQMYAFTVLTLAAGESLDQLRESLKPITMRI